MLVLTSLAKFVISTARLLGRASKVLKAITLLKVEAIDYGIGNAEAMDELVGEVKTWVEKGMGSGS